MRHANKVKKPFSYSPASVSMADPEYLRKRFAQIRKQQKEEAEKVQLEQQAKVRKIK